MIFFHYDLFVNRVFVWVSFFPLLMLINRKDFIHTSVGLQGPSPQHRDATASNNDNSIFPQFNGNFLLDEEGTNPSTSSSSYVCRYLQMNTDDDLFPVLIRRDSYPGMVFIFLFIIFFDLFFYMLA